MGFVDLIINPTPFNLVLRLLGGDMTAKGALVAQPFPPFVQKYPDIISRIKATGAFNSSAHEEPNHIIMNEYLPGQGIMPHEDGPRYHPVVTTLSLGSHAVFHYYQYQKDDEIGAVTRGIGKTINTTPVSSILLEPRSLVISSGTMYTTHLHGIEEVEEDVISPKTDMPGVVLSNLDRLRDPLIKSLIERGTPLKRGVRYSLTCRDVERVSSISVLSRH
ncbi:dioxygenase [Psilocybe cyanescens]|uniref:Dioxygenase n=1 Tax=Psilocybe cyanescens TaxID=93625 RepID=A0A409WXG5_PSICY|nr:dioxygenase [Psilocybe cyanescens]